MSKSKKKASQTVQQELKAAPNGKPGLKPDIAPNQEPKKKPDTAPNQEPRKKQTQSKPSALAEKAAGPKGIQGWLWRNWSYILAFIIPVILTYVSYRLFGLEPSGKHSVLCLDLNGQYVYFFEAIRDAFHGEGSILYNWSRNLSGGYMGIIGYYLASPFTLIVILLPRTMILGALLIMILCKIGATSFAFSYYARKSKHVSPGISVVLGCMFGMCAYSIIQTIDPMWLDGLVCLPFIVLGIEYLVDDGRKINLIVPLALICIANFYIGFMCCIFTAIYFVYYLFIGSDKYDNNLRPIVFGAVFLAALTVLFGFLYRLQEQGSINLEYKDPVKRIRYYDYKNFMILAALATVLYIGFLVYYYIYKSDKDRRKEFNKFLFACLRMVIAAVVALSCAAFMVLPVYNALSLGKMDFAKPSGGYNFGWKGQFSPLEFIAQFSVNQYNSVNVEGKPEVYCGVLGLLCVPLFFCNKRIPWRQKVGYGILCFTMFFCMFFKEIDIWWHGGQMPNWLPFRYSFIFSFIVLSMAAMTLRYAGGINKIAAGVSALVLSVLMYMAYSQHYLNMKGKVYLEKFPIMLTIMLLVVYAGFVVVLGLKNPSKTMKIAVPALLMAVVGCELVYNTKWEFKDIHTEVAYSDGKTYRAYVASHRDVVDQIYDYDKSFYRLEKTYTRTVNDNSGMKIRGMTHSSSVMNSKILKFIEAMGYSASTYYSRYDGNTPLADSVLGIKYVMDKGDDNTNILKDDDPQNANVSAAYKKVMTATAKSQTESDITINVYENKNALSIGFMADESIKRIEKYGNDNPFNSQNLLLSTISGNTVITDGGGFESFHEYYHPLSVIQYPELEEKGISNPRLNNARVTDYAGQQNFREPNWDPNNPTVHEGDPTVDLFLETEAEEPLYLFFKTENQSKVNLWLADQWNLDGPTCYNKDGSNANGLGSYFEGDNYKILYVGTFPAHTQLQLRMTLLTNADFTKEKYTIIKNFFFYHFNSDLFEQDIQKLKQQEWNLTTYGGRTLEGTITAKEKQIMMTTIPAEPGWRIWVDGKEYRYTATKTYSDGTKKEIDEPFVTLFQGMIGVELEPGEHTVKMVYTPPGMNVGWGLLIFGLACITLFFFYDRKHNAAWVQLREGKKKGIYELPYEEYPDPDAPRYYRSNVQNNKQQQTKDTAQLKTVMVADELKKLKGLMDDGIITQEEFDEQKKKLLNRK